MAIGSREDAVRSLINIWLRLPQMSCVTCGMNFEEGRRCCDTMVIANNHDTLTRFMEELQALRETRTNVHGSNKDKTMRLGISIPQGLYNFLDQAFTRMYGEKLFGTKKDMYWFAKHFPKFQVPERM